MTWNDIYQAINMKMVNFMNLGEANFVAKGERGDTMSFYACCKPDGIEVHLFGKKCLIPMEEKMDKGAYKRCICHGIYKIYNTPNDPGVTASDEIEVQENKKTMKKRTINEQQLRRVIRVAARKLIKEGTTDNAYLGYWEDVKELIGADRMVDFLWNYLNADQIRNFIEWIDRIVYGDSGYKIIPVADVADDEEEYPEA